MIRSNAWIDLYQPKTVDECFLPKATREQINSILATGDVPSMFFAGPAGIGKTTLAKAICSQLDLESMIINASLHGNIEMIRTDIQAFASSLSFNGKKKVIILDEADGLTPAAQASLRAVINEYVDNVAFILTANFRNKIIDPIISRLTEVDFLFPKAELPNLARSLYNFIIERLKEEDVDYDVKAVQQFIMKNLQQSTDIRKLIIKAQKIAKTKVFNTDSLIDVDDSRLGDLIQVIKSKNFDAIRTWVGENSDIDFAEISRYVYSNAQKHFDKEKLPMIVMCINQHQFQHAFVVDKEINLASMLAEISISL